MAEEQLLVYYESHALAKAELNFSLIEKFAYTLVLASQKFCPYLITVLTDQPLKNVLQRLDASGRLFKWAVERSEYDLTFDVW